jgi:hypothetical protein
MSCEISHSYIGKSLPEDYGSERTTVRLKIKHLDSEGSSAKTEVGFDVSACGKPVYEIGKADGRGSFQKAYCAGRIARLEAGIPQPNRFKMGAYIQPAETPASGLA